MCIYIYIHPEMDPNPKDDSSIRKVTSAQKGFHLIYVYGRAWARKATYTTCCAA